MIRAPSEYLVPLRAASNDLQMARRRRASPSASPSSNHKRIRMENCMRTKEELISEGDVSTSNGNASHHDTLEVIKVENDEGDYSHVAMFSHSAGVIQKVSAASAFRPTHRNSHIAVKPIPVSVVHAPLERPPPRKKGRPPMPGNRHEAQYVDEESNEDFVCDWVGCGAVLRGEKGLIEHVADSHVNNSTDFVCRWAGCFRKQLPFTALYMLVTHVRRHTGDKPHCCTFPGCMKAYGRLENLKTHIRTHTGERPYKCEVETCGKAFSNASDRAKHQTRTHSQTKPYVCPFVDACDKSYTDPSSLRKHIKTVHGDDAFKKIKEMKAKQPVTPPQRAPKKVSKRRATPIPRAGDSPPVPHGSRGRHPYEAVIVQAGFDGHIYHDDELPEPTAPTPVRLPPQRVSASSILQPIDDDSYEVTCATPIPRRDGSPSAFSRPISATSGTHSPIDVGTYHLHAPSSDEKKPRVKKEEEDVDVDIIGNEEIDVTGSASNSPQPRRVPGGY
ncbi:hypothetical protein QR680_002331 [Steinernema hermaphroditum]|uniref:C2H2-type domain-containing protein n=1 Tax=Steinernema hermaphroditum TaxID=289476 RepID=A0AA39LI22_9BILA|nr:hypothetical protein QR680_002331 [Steinernema hermaphroditum]